MRESLCNIYSSVFLRSTVLLFLCKHSKRETHKHTETKIYKNNNSTATPPHYCHYWNNDFTWLAPHRLQMEASQIPPLPPHLQGVYQSLPESQTKYIIEKKAALQNSKSVVIKYLCMASTSQGGHQDAIRHIWRSYSIQWHINRLFVYDVTSLHCGDGCGWGSRVIFYKGSTITSRQNAKGLLCLRSLKLIKLRNHKEILLSTKSCYSQGGKKWKKLTEKRWQKWLVNLRLQSGRADSDNARVGSDHFIKGKVT